MKFVKTVINLVKALFRLGDILNRSVTSLNLDDYDKHALALGRWEMYKSISNIVFQGQMDKDVESLLFQKTFMKIGKGKPLTGDQALDQVVMMIDVCQEAKLSGASVKWVLERFN